MKALIFMVVVDSLLTCGSQLRVRFITEKSLTEREREREREKERERKERKKERKRERKKKRKK